MFLPLQHTTFSEYRQRNLMFPQYNNREAVHETARDEARHGAVRKGLLETYFKQAATESKPNEVDLIRRGRAAE